MYEQNPYGPYSQKSYGPINALADILGAYMQHKNEVGAYNDAAAVGAQADKAGQLQYQQTLPQPEQDASQTLAQNFIPHKVDPVADMAAINPTINTAMGSGLRGALQQLNADNPNKNQLTMDMAQSPKVSDLAQSQPPTTQPQDQTDSSTQKPFGLSAAIQESQPQTSTSLPISTRFSTGQPQAPDQAQPQDQSVADDSTAIPQADSSQQGQDQQPIADTSSQPATGLAGALQQYKAQQSQPNVLNSVQGWANDNPSSPQNMQGKYDQFAAAKAANPDWYVGDTYVGTDAAAKAKAQAALPQVQASQQQSQENQQFTNPMQQEYGFQDDQAPKQLSYNEYAAQLKSLEPQAMKEMVAKHGLAMADKLQPMIRQTIQDKLSAYGDQQDAQNQRAIAPYLLRDLSTPAAKQQALWALANYNNTAKQMGKPGLDMSSMAQIIGANDVNISAKDLGGQIQYIATPKNAATFNDGSAFKPIFAMAKTVTPDTVYKQTTVPASLVYQTTTVPAKDVYNKNTLSADTKYSADHRPQSSAGSNGQANTRLNAAYKYVQAHASWMKNHSDADDTKDPNWGTVQQAQQVIAQTAGLGGGAQTSNNQEPASFNDYGQAMQFLTDKLYNNKMHGNQWSKDQMVKYIQDQYGDFAPKLIDDVDWSSYY